MLQGVNIDEVRKYNASLKQYKDQSARLTVEIEMNEKELKQLCEQLSTELGVTVTPENVEQIYEEQVSKINQTLETGNAILKKIEQEALGVQNNPVGSLPNTAPSMGIPNSPAGTNGTLFTGKSLGNIDKLPQPGAPVPPTTPFNSGTPFFSL